MAEGDGLENRCARKGTGGSNPSPSASDDTFRTLSVFDRAIREVKLCCACRGSVNGGIAARPRLLTSQSLSNYPLPLCLIPFPRRVTWRPL